MAGQSDTSDFRRRPGAAALILAALARHQPRLFADLDAAIEQVPGWRGRRTPELWRAVHAVLGTYGLNILDVRADWLTPALWALIQTKRRQPGLSLHQLAGTTGAAPKRDSRRRNDRRPLTDSSADAFVRWYVNREAVKQIAGETDPESLRRHLQSLRVDLGFLPRSPGRPRKTRSQSR